MNDRALGIVRIGPRVLTATAATTATAGRTRTAILGSTIVGSVGGGGLVIIGGLVAGRSLSRALDGAGRAAAASTPTAATATGRT